MKRVVIIVAQNFQDEEFVYPYYRVLEEGFRLDVATPGGQNMIGKYGVPARATMSTDNLKASDFDCVILPGGFESPDRLRIRPEVLQFVRQMTEAGKLVAAICHGPWILISAGVVKGRKVTGYMSIADDLKNAGAIYTEQDVVIDGNLISAPHYKNNGEFMKAVLAALRN
ncbi:MAG TPA: type 1 glutamine amidotransferase domain-containing protein [Sedimentisphaerales bacterium]|nr:type 1 glutamine amidotransferase [Phycisphaerae bacterium]HON91917.1 type 1 glutamine amidotransferase domain-containing protein [Sedimentisphaerales bacterium]HQI29038.1 type 1 glutamine amidotransferase domain-containing protein [Sedimentisphaerales bacterium]